MAEDYIRMSETARAFAASYPAAFKEKDATKMSTTLTQECIRTMEPKSFARLVNQSSMTVKEYEDRMSAEFQVMELGSMHFEKMVIDTKSRSVSARASGNMKLKDGRTDILEFVFFLDLTDDLRQIKAIRQFVDSAKANEVLAHFQAILADRK
jgi:hypothetical protein